MKTLNKQDRDDLRLAIARDILTAIAPSIPWRDPEFNHPVEAPELARICMLYAETLISERENPS